MYYYGMTHLSPDINECLANNGHGPCQDTCRNLEGTYECSCTDIPGYELANDHHTCVDIDECALDNANCSHVCLNTPGSVFCLCPDGFYLTDNWRICQGIFSRGIFVSLFFLPNKNHESRDNI